jgi:hypothetical protein
MCLKDCTAPPFGKLSGHKTNAYLANGLMASMVHMSWKLGTCSQLVPGGLLITYLLLLLLVILVE